MIRWAGLFVFFILISLIWPAQAAEPQEVGYIDLKLDLARLLGKKVRVKGGFHYLEEDHNSFLLRLDNNSVIIDLQKLPEESRLAVNTLRDFSEIPINVIGTVERGGVQRDQPAILAERLDIEDSSTRNTYRHRRGIVTVPELQVNPPRFLHSSVSMEGRFDFLQPGREAFRMWRGVDEVEVDYSHLSVELKRQIMGVKNFSDRGLKVSGILLEAPSKEVAFGLEATSLQIDPSLDSAATPPSSTENGSSLTYAAILQQPAQYANKSQTLVGGFELCDPRRKTLQIWQGSDSIEVYYRDLPPDQIDLIESQRPFNGIALQVTGLVRPYPKMPRRFMIEAKRVSLDKGE